MISQDKTKEELIKELHELEQRVRELEASKTLRGQSHIGELVDTLHAGVVIHGKNGTEVIDCNTTALNILGVTREQLVGRNTFDSTWTFLLEDGSPMPVEGYPVSRVIATKKIVPSMIMGIQHADKPDPTWIVATAVPELDENGCIIQIILSYMDISSLKKSEEQYRNLFENMMNEVHLWKLARDEQGAIKTWQLIEANPTALKAWGKNRSDIIGKTTDEVFLHNVTEQFMPVVKKIFSEGTPHTWEAYFPPTGQFLYMTSVPFGEYFITTGQDITERKRIEEALRNSEAKYRNLVENTHQGMTIMQTDTMKIHFVNKSMEALLGYSIEETLSATSEQLTARIHPDDRERAFNSMARWLSGEPEPTSDIRYRLIHKDGRVRWMDIASTLVEHDGKPAIQSIYIDVTARVEAEEALRRSEQEFRTLVANIPDTVQRLTREGVHLYVNPLFAQMMGMNQADIIGKSNEELGLPSNLIKRLDDLRETAYTSKQAVDLDFDFTVAGESRHLYTRLVPELDEEGNVVSLLGITRDITKRKRMEEALRKSETELRELNAQKDKFFSIIAHDLRSPFNSITGLSTLLIGRIKEKDLEEIDKYAMLIEQSSKQALNLLTNLLDWSRAETGRMYFNPENIELVDLIEESTMLFDAIADQKAITIKKVLPHELPVFADKPMINTVLRNLISNALKFTRQDGEITISAEKRSKEILISVSDTGVGIAPGRLEKLFLIGESNSTSGTKNEKGTGLGLILCKEFVENHGGKIWAESEDKKGSAFYFTLPCDAN